MSTKKYFLSFDYFDGNGLNKYHWSVLDIDISETSLQEVCQIIVEQTIGYWSDDIRIKIIAFNNVE